MRILITTHHLDNRAGSELFTANLVSELKKRGHHLYVFSPILGKISEEIMRKGVTVVEDLRLLKKVKIDIIHAQHNTTAILARSIFPDTPMIFMSHGALPELEQIPSIDIGIGKYVAVSEEIKNHIIQNYGIEEERIKIIRNFVDADVFRSKKELNKKPKNLLIITNHYADDVRSVIEGACRDLNIEFLHIGLPDNPVSNVESHINNSDIVVTLGRGALEAMACERNVIVFDVHGGDGFVDNKNFFEIRKNNFSGRRFKYKYTVESFKEEIKKYNPSLGKLLRKIVEAENSLSVTVDALENIYEDIRNVKCEKSQITKGQLYNEIFFLEQAFKVKKYPKLVIEKQSKQIENINKERELLREKLILSDQKIQLMEASFFWKLRKIYLKLKEKVMFVFGKIAPKKQRLRILRLCKDVKRSLRQEGFLRMTRRVFNFLVYGKGFLSNIKKNVILSYEKEESVTPQLYNEEFFEKLNVVPHYLNPYFSINNELIGEKEGITIGIHLHLFHEEMSDVCIKYLSNIPLPFDLFISVKNDADTKRISSEFELKIDNVKNVFVEKTPNRGRDIAPLIVQFGERLAKYDIISHFHTKKSSHWDKFNGWFTSIMNILYGSREKIFQIIELLTKGDGKIVYPEGNRNIVLDRTGWSANYDISKDILKKYGDLDISNFNRIDFSQGSMFWARGNAMEDFLKLPLKYSDFPKEPIAVDGTIAHALERLLLVFASKSAGICYRLHESDSSGDYRYYEDQEDFSEKIKHKSIKVLSYYLPQFHPIPENDEWHGKGFTEWYNVRKTNPFFCGHYQQHIPHEDLGYYLIDGPEMLKKQAGMMKKGGVYGQIFYHYWFTGKLILEKPAQILLKNADIKMPFCFCWANENWTKCWDGNEKEVLLSQKYSSKDAREFIRYLIPFFKDKRYIKIEGRPVLFVYRPASFPDFSLYKEIWKDECAKENIDEPYLVATLTRGAVSPLDYEMDAGAERVLHDWTDGNVGNIKDSLKKYRPMNGSVLEYKDVAKFYMKQTDKKDFTYFRSIVPVWDNTARYKEDAMLLHNCATDVFQKWMSSLVNFTEKTLPQNKQFIIVNAWNEWAEGAHLEPDVKFGYGYLNSIGRSLSDESYGYNQDLLLDYSKSRELKIKIDFSKEALDFLRENDLARSKFINCLTNSTVFKLWNIYIQNEEIIKYIKKSGYTKEVLSGKIESKDFTLLIGEIGCFSVDMLEKVISMGLKNKTSVICANSLSDRILEGVEILDNASIDSRHVSSIRLYPEIKNDYRNFKICWDALFSKLIDDRLDYGNLPVITTVIRFHEAGDLKLLNNALISLLSQSDCIVQPLIATHNLSSNKLEELKKVVHQYGWDKNYPPIIKEFFSEMGKDIRSKTLNESIKSIKTKYAAILDYDDTLFPFAYKWLINRLKKTNKAVSFGRVFVSKFVKRKMQVLERATIYKNGSDYREFLANNHAPLHSFILDLEKIDVSALKYFDDMKYLEDYYMTLQLFTENNVDWESLGENQFIGDYMHCVDMEHTLATTEDDKRKSITKTEEYLVCERRINDFKKELICEK